MFRTRPSQTCAEEHHTRNTAPRSKGAGQAVATVASTGSSETRLKSPTALSAFPIPKRWASGLQETVFSFRPAANPSLRASPQRQAHDRCARRVEHATTPRRFGCPCFRCNGCSKQPNFLGLLIHPKLLDERDRVLLQADRNMHSGGPKHQECRL